MGWGTTLKRLDVEISTSTSAYYRSPGAPDRSDAPDAAAERARIATPRTSARRCGARRGGLVLVDLFARDPGKAGQIAQGGTLDAAPLRRP